MGRQILFYMDVETEGHFVDFVSEEGCVLSRMTNPLSVVRTLPEPFSGDFWAKMHLYKHDFGEIVTGHYPDGMISIDSIISPVIEFHRSVVDHEECAIRRGRLWVEPKYYDENGTLVEKPKELVLWYNKLTRWVKKNLEAFELHGHKFYISAGMKQFLDESGYKIS